MGKWWHVSCLLVHGRGARAMSKIPVEIWMRFRQGGSWASIASEQPDKVRVINHSIVKGRAS